MKKITLFPVISAIVIALSAQATPAKRQGMPHKGHVGSTGSTIAVATRNATVEPVAGGFVNAVQIYPFSEGTVYRVYTAPGQVTDITLQPGEQLGSVASGDTVRWVIGDTSSGSGADKRTHVLIKPFTAGLATNVIITTDRRTYRLALSSGRGPAMAALSWSYPLDALIALKKQQDQAADAAAAAPVAAGVPIDNLQFGYAITGDRPAWRPLRAFDDGRQTYIEFPETLGVSEAPPLFIVGEKGEAQLVNYRLRGNYYVVDRLFDVAELRLGAKKQAIVRIRRLTPRSARKGA